MLIEAESFLHGAIMGSKDLLGLGDFLVVILKATSNVRGGSYIWTLELRTVNGIQNLKV